MSDDSWGSLGTNVTCRRDTHRTFCIDAVTLDLKGYQYHGKIHSGPTALVLVLGKAGQLKVDAITDEFITVRKTHDVMAKLNAVVRGDMDAGYNVVEENVNVTKEKKDEGDNEPVAKKRKVSAKKKKS